jgi:SHS2 domain-containing protein
MYEIFEHTADVGIRIRAATLDELFADAARGLFSVMVANLDAVAPVQQECVHLTNEANRLDDLLFDWLDDLLYRFDTRRVLFSRFEVQIEGKDLRATIWGEPMDRSRHEMDGEVKAITYHGLILQHDTDGWLAEVIVDM